MFSVFSPLLAVHNYDNIDDRCDDSDTYRYLRPTSLQKIINEHNFLKYWLLYNAQRCTMKQNLEVILYKLLFVQKIIFTSCIFNAQIFNQEHLMFEYMCMSFFFKIIMF